MIGQYSFLSLSLYINISFLSVGYICQYKYLALDKRYKKYLHVSILA